MSRGRLVPSIAAFGFLAVLFSPCLFFTFRLMVFDTVPRDDYARYLLWLLNEPGSTFPGSPYGYRILSVLAGAPFYYLLPALPLTNLPAVIEPHYLRATAALAIVSYLAMLAGAVLAYRLLVSRYLCSKADGLFAASFVVLCELNTSFYGIDPLAFLLIIAALYTIDRPVLFAVIVSASILFNEKVPIVLGAWLSIRWMLDPDIRKQFRTPLIVLILAIAAYATMLAIVRMEGHSEQLDAGVYFPTIIQNVVATFMTPRGYVLNILPCVLLVGGVCWSWWYLDTRRSGIYSTLDLLVVPVLILLALALTQFFQVGRIALHAAPLFMLPIAQALGLWLRRESPAMTR